MMLEAKDIRVRIGRKDILHGCDLTAKAGQVSAIVGPNGSGKSTLIKAITGDLPFTGQVHLNGGDTAAMQPWELASIRGVLPQASTLAFPFTAIEVVRIGMREGLDGDIEDRAQTALARVGLAHFANNFYQELSGGEQQRVQLARVLAQVWEPSREGVPSWLLLDEPVSSLDIAHQLSVMRIARDYADAGGGVVAVMHDLNLTSMVADHIVLIDKGRVVANGHPRDVLTDQTLSPVYGCNIRIGETPSTAAPWFLPHTIEAAPVSG